MTVRKNNHFGRIATIWMYCACKTKRNRLLCLSGELSTLLGGRYEKIHLQGLNYRELLEFHELEDSDVSLWQYLHYGGLPGLRNVGLENEDMVCDYLSGVFNTIMLKDVIERHTIRNIPFLNNLMVFLADTAGKLNSANSIAKYMKSQGQDVSTNAVLNIGITTVEKE